MRSISTLISLNILKKCMLGGPIQLIYYLWFLQGQILFVLSVEAFLLQQIKKVAPMDSLSQQQLLDSPL